MICAGCARSIPADEAHQICTANNCRRHFHNTCSCGKHGVQYMQPVSATARQVLRPQGSTPQHVNPPVVPPPIVNLPPPIQTTPRSPTTSRAGLSIMIGAGSFLFIIAGVVVVAVIVFGIMASSRSNTNSGGNVNQNTSPEYPTQAAPVNTLPSYTEPPVIPTNTQYIRPTMTSAPITSCPGAPAQRLEVNEDAEVCTRKDRVFLRDSPNRSGGITDSLDPGTVVWVLDGPECANNWSWWKVRTPNGQIGWMAEGGDSKDSYFLCPN